MPLSVCFVVRHGLGTWLPGTVPFGGAEVKTSQFARHLAKDPRFDVRFVCHGAEHQDLVVDNVRVQARPYTHHLLKNLPLARLAGAQLALVRELRRQRADVYIEAPGGAETISTALAARWTGAPFVFWVSSNMDLDGTLATNLGAALGTGYKWALRNAAYVICQTEDQRHRVQEAFGLQAGIVPNVPRTPPEPLAVPRDEVLWIGHWTAVKGPRAFLDLARAFPQNRFRMVASTPMPSEFGPLPGNVTVSCQVPPDEVWAYLCRALVLVNTSVTEGFPNIFLEAGLARTPILSLNANPDQILDRHGLGACAAGNPQVQSIQLQRFLAEPELRLRCGESGYRYVREYHDTGAAVQRLTDILLRLVPDRSL